MQTSVEISNTYLSIECQIHSLHINRVLDAVENVFRWRRQH